MKNKIVFMGIGIAAFISFSIPVFASTKSSLKKVDAMVKTQTGIDTGLIQNLSDADIEKEIENILNEPLSVGGAVKIAILNNPSVKAAMAGLGISQADLVQAGLLHNPRFSGFVRKSNEEDSKTNTEFEVKGDVMDLFFWPLRKRLASTQFKQSEYELAKTIVDFITDVRIGFYTWQASTHMLAMRQEHFKAEEAALELAERQKQAGNINDLDLEQQKAIYYQAKTDLQRSELEAGLAAEQLRNFLGLTDSNLEWLSQKNLSDLPSDEFSLSDLEEKALANRIDLAMKQQQLKAFEQSLTMARLGVIPSVEGGYNWEKESNGERLKGPAFETEVPVFDRKQADRLRVQSQIEAGKKQLEALGSQVRMEVRLAYGQLTSDKAMVETYMQAIPIRREILKQTLSHYNYMLKGVYDLLRAKQEEINTRRDYIMALRDYWIARAELEHAVGVFLPVKESTVQEKFMKEPEIEPEHHHHGGTK